MSCIVSFFFFSLTQCVKRTLWISTNVLAYVWKWLVMCLRFFFFSITRFYRFVVVCVVMGCAFSFFFFFLCGIKPFLLLPRWVQSSLAVFPFFFSLLLFIYFIFFFGGCWCNCCLLVTFPMAEICYLLRLNCWSLLLCAKCDLFFFFFSNYQWVFAIVAAACHKVM